MIDKKKLFSRFEAIWMENDLPTTTMSEFIAEQYDIVLETRRHISCLDKEEVKAEQEWFE